MREKLPPIGPFWSIFVRGGCILALLATFVGAMAQTSPVHWPDSLRKLSNEEAINVVRKEIQKSPQKSAQLWYLGGVYFGKLARYDSARVYLNKALAQYINSKDSAGIADTYFESANILTLTNRYKESIPIQQKAFVLYQKIRNNTGAINSLLNLGYNSYRLKKLPQAKDFYAQALERARRNGNYERMVDAHDGLAVTYEAMKDYRNAITNIRLMQGAYDSIVIRDHRKQLKALEDKYLEQLEQKDRALVETESQHRQVQSDRLLRLIERDDIRLTFYLVALAMAVIMLALLIAWLLTQRQARMSDMKLKREQAGVRLANEQFELISRQVHDDLTRNLNEISFSTSQFSTGRSEEEIKVTAGLLKSQCEALIGSMMDLVWLINPNNRSLEGFIAFIRERANLFLKNSGLNFMIVVPDRIPTLELSTLERVNLYHVTSDLLQHSVHSSKAQGITLSMTIEGKQLIFKIKESNGAVTEQKIAMRAEDLKPHRKKMEQINGTIGVVSESGAMVIIYRKELY